jgi:membrane-bound serine protease (ClpP class)
LIKGPALNLALGIIGSLVLLFLMMKYLPQLGLVERNLLPGSLGKGNGEDEVMGRRVGLRGTATTDLRPSGMAEIDGETIEVLADGVFLDRGESLCVISDDGMGVTVKKVQA